MPCQGCGAEIALRECVAVSAHRARRFHRSGRTPQSPRRISGFSGHEVLQPLPGAAEVPIRAQALERGDHHNLFALFNSSAFVSFLEEMTGFDGLIPDAGFEGGGLHETKPGGHLSIHADFNLHQKLGLIRQLNLLIYLNDDWSPAYGGNLELWDQAMNAGEIAVAPELGRAVVFTTALDSYHGHPDPLACPPDRSRRSMAPSTAPLPRTAWPTFRCVTRSFRFVRGRATRPTGRSRHNTSSTTGCRSPSGGDCPSPRSNDRLPAKPPLNS
jgi:hypothetical protein